MRTWLCYYCVLGITLLLQVRSSIIEGFSLVDTTTNTLLRTLPSGGTIDPAIDGAHLTIVLDVTNTSAIGFVQFSFQNDPTYATEQVAPYALAGDRNGQYDPEPALQQTGNYTLGATVHAATSNDLLEHLSIRFSVVNGAREETTHAEPNEFPIASIIRHDAPSVLPQPPNIQEILIDAPSSTQASSDVPAYHHSPVGALTGTLRQWHKVTLGFDGPPDAIESTTNEFRLDVTFRHGDGKTVLVIPGYYAADGNAANTGASTGPVWLVHLCPPAVGNWEWEASFTRGEQQQTLSAGYFDKQRGSFLVKESDKTGRDHRGKGRLEYVEGYHHLRFAGTNKFFLKGGADSPENLLAYEDFDNTPNFGSRRKDWAPHIQDFRSGDPTWSGGKGKGIIGALNYLAREKGMNVVSFLTLNIGGDDKNVFPYTSYKSEDRLNIDVSKLAQWEVVFEHADKLGLLLHAKLQERELDFLLDAGELGRERRFYYRELIARFGHHLALIWNLGEENGNTLSQQTDFSDYIKSVDPYKSPIVIHDSVYNKDSLYGGLLGAKSVNGISLQTRAGFVFDETLQWISQSASSGQHWIVANDEQNPASVGVLPDSVDPLHNAIRRDVLWGNFIAGGSGVEYYFGYKHDNSDLTCNDFRSRDQMWTQTKYALDFFETYVPFWKMTNMDHLVSSTTAHCLANDNVFVVHLPKGGSTMIDMPPGIFRVLWFDPLKGRTEEVASVNGGTTVSVGRSPYLESQDWVVLLTQQQST